MKNFCLNLFLASILCVKQAFGAEAGMPQLETEFWSAQVFWLILTFSILYLIIWKIFLPRITYSIENRKLRITNDLNEAEKLKENAEKKLKEYNIIIENSKKEAQKIIEDSKKKLDKSIEEKKNFFNNQIEKELENAEKEIKDLKKSSISNINKIASETSAEIIKQIIDKEVNMSNVSAITSDITKRKLEKYI
tara:strand:+ start:1694 stop:2272 length:579 start_codon:yes stop_codon:yes gene_type:complete